MKRMLIALATVVAMICIGIGGISYGQKTADEYWGPKISEAQGLLTEGTYRMAWTNTRACVLAADSSLMRFLSTPTPEALAELRARYGACEQHWELLNKYSPDDPEEYRNIDEARWMFDNWGMQIEHIIEMQIRLILAANEGREQQMLLLYQGLIEERAESKKFRDHIERELFEAW
jgi:hypothetical protein